MWRFARPESLAAERKQYRKAVIEALYKWYRNFPVIAVGTGKVDFV